MVVVSVGIGGREGGRSKDGCRGMRRGGFGWAIR